MKIMLTVNEIKAGESLINALQLNMHQIANLTGEKMGHMFSALEQTDFEDEEGLQAIFDEIKMESNGALEIVQYRDAEGIKCFQFDLDEAFVIEATNLTSDFLSEIMDGLKSIVKGVYLLYHTKVKAFMAKWNIRR